MGWMWSSATPEAPSAESPSQDNTSQTPTSQQAPAKKASTKRKKDVKDHPDYELAKLFYQIQQELGVKPSAADDAEPAKPTSAAPPEQQQQQQQQQQRSTTSFSSLFLPSWGSWSVSAAKASPSSTSPSRSSSAAAAQQGDVQQQQQEPTSTPTPTTTNFSEQQQQQEQQEQEPSSTYDDADDDDDDDDADGRLDPLSESLLPTTMSCQSAFDYAHHCNSMGGHWLSLYRHGEVRPCSEAWADFWFCMRTRTYGRAVKRDAIQNYYRQKEIRKYRAPGRPSSTDVWEARTEPVPPGAAFRQPYQDLPDGVTDEEWYAAQIERRRRVQEALAREEKGGRGREGEGEGEGA